MSQGLSHLRCLEDRVQTLRNTVDVTFWVVEITMIATLEQNCWRSCWMVLPNHFFVADCETEHSVPSKVLQLEPLWNVPPWLSHARVPSNPRHSPTDSTS
jgi:hypothetical protein